MRNVTDKLWRHLGREGWSGRLISISHLADLRDEIHGSHDLGLFNEEFFEEQLNWFSFDPPEELPGAQSLIVVAVPAPQGRVVFHWQGEQISLVLPPTYAGYRRTTGQVRDRLAAFLGGEGFKVADTRLPLKILAARGGLADYGRNNILYHDGVGSFLQLCAYYSDLPCGEDSWQKPAMMKRCQSCTACTRICPTSAISPDRFLLRAERCITFHNERTCPLPGWLGSGWHDSLIGCMLCQRVCPANREVKNRIVDRARFSEEETAQLLRPDAEHPLRPETLARWKELGLSEDFGLLMRNLSAILALRLGSDHGILQEIR